MIGLILGVLYLGFAVLLGGNSAQVFLSVLNCLEWWYLLWGIGWCVSMGVLMLVAALGNEHKSGEMFLLFLIAGFVAAVHFALCYCGARLMYTSLPASSLNFAEVDVVRMVLGVVVLFVGCCFTMNLSSSKD